MGVVEQYQISTAFPSTVGGTSGSLQYFFSQPPQSLWNVGVLGVNAPSQSSQLGLVPSATNSTGMLAFDASGFKLQGGRFRLYASGSATNTVGSPTFTPVVQIVTPNVTTGSIYNTPVYTNFLMGTPSSVMTAGNPDAFSVAADLFFDPASGTLSGTQTWQIVPKSGSASAVTTQLGSAANYAVLAGAGITNTGNTVVLGGVIGSYPTQTVTGFPPGVATIDEVDAQAAQAAALTAYNFYVAYSTGAQAITTADLGTQQGNGSGVNGTYRAGKYTSPSSIAITTPIIMDAQGNANALFVFYATGSTVTQAAAGTITLVNGAQANNVIWVVGSSWTTVGPGAVTVGNILANTSITLGGGTLNGRALAGIVTTSGAVTISTATAITVPGSFSVTSSGIVVISPAIQGLVAATPVSPTIPGQVTNTYGSNPGFGFVVGVTFSSGGIGNSASLYEFKLIQD